jgi:hypothetical protein
VEEVIHVPAWEFAIIIYFADTFFVAFAEELHANYGEDEDDDGQHQGEVSQSPH